MRLSSLVLRAAVGSLLWMTLAQAQQATPPPPTPPAQASCETRLKIADNYTTILFANSKHFEAMTVELTERNTDLTKRLTEAQAEITRLAPKHEETPAAPKDTN